MAAHPIAHPSADALRAFALGKLNDISAAALMNHLDDCPDCCKQVAAISGDDFLARLRQARSHSSTSTPAKALSETAGGMKPAPNRPVIANIPPELAANQQYEILRELGRGGMGVVYLAKNKLMDRLEVLKVVNKTLLDQPGAVERFLREIRSAAKLSHANVVTAYSAVQQDELLAFAMEYVEGQDLASLVKSQGPLPIVNACFYVQQAAMGLQHAYEKGMVHRDIKPQNLMLAREGKKHIVKVLDFGLAKVIREKSEDTGLTGEGKMLGTPDYIAPEQTMDAAKADIRADIYSLGCTLYYLLSGHPPFSASSLGAILVAHQMHEAKPLNLVHPEVPEELAAVVRKMMAKSPAKRYQTPLQAAQALSPYVKQGVTPRVSPELSAGVAEPKTAVKKAAEGDRSVAPAAKEAKKQPKPAAVPESPTEDSNSSDEPRRREKYSDLTVGSNLAHGSPSAGPQKSRTDRKRQPPSARTVTRKKWLIGGGIGVGVLLLALLGMWASDVFKGKTKEDTSAREKLPPGAQAPSRIAPAKDPLDQWFAVGTRWEGQIVFATLAGLRENIWYTILFREGNKFKGRLLSETRGDQTIEGTLEKDGTSFRWTNFRQTPTIWRPQQDVASFTAEGKCRAESVLVDFNYTKLDGTFFAGYCEFTTRDAGPRKDDEEIWPRPLHPRRAATGPPSGKWSIQGEELVQEEFVEDVGNPPSIIFGDLAWKDYDLHLKAMKTAGDRGLVVAFDIVRPFKNGTKWCIDLNGQTYLELAEALHTGWEFTPLSDRKQRAILNNHWYDIRIKTRGQWIECILDGERVFKTPHADRCGGKIGLLCRRVAARFKDIELTAPDGKVLWKKGPPELPRGN